jgi:hypothetical protein
VNGLRSRAEKDAPWLLGAEHGSVLPWLPLALAEPGGPPPDDARDPGVTSRLKSVGAPLLEPTLPERSDAAHEMMASTGVLCSG